MSEAKHTPGPWTISDDHGQRWIETTAGNDDTIAQVFRRNNSVSAARDIEYTANAHLIAAAPELLEALKEITSDYADRFDLDSLSTNPGIKSSIKQARTAIAKATGASNG